MGVNLHAWGINGEMQNLKIAMKNADIIGFLDADLGSSANDIKKLISPIINDEADVIIASRHMRYLEKGLIFPSRLRI